MNLNKSGMYWPLLNFEYMLYDTGFILNGKFKVSVSIVSFLR